LVSRDLHARRLEGMILVARGLDGLVPDHVGIDIEVAAAVGSEVLVDHGEADGAVIGLRQGYGLLSRGRNCRAAEETGCSKSQRS